MRWLFSLLSLASAADLIVANQTVSLAGDQTYDSVQVINGGRINVTPYNGSTGGYLNITATSVLIEVSSSIVASGSGFRGGAPGATGEGTGGGPGTVDGGGNPGTGGGGGNGGGAVWILASELTMAGTITVNGANGVVGSNDSGGGGAGGAIMLVGENISCTGTLVAAGGNGATSVNGTDTGGGGGIEQYCLSSGTTCAMSAPAGTSQCTNQGANPGPTSALSADPDSFDWDVDGYIDDDCGPTDPTINPAAT